jgi:hypothetical protein
VNTGLDENETEFRIAVFSVDFQVLSNRDGFFDEVPEVLWDRWGKA